MSNLALPDAVDTERLGAALANSLRWSKTAAVVIHLQGELGSGKTTLARGLLRELGITGTVRSPTYTLLESYESSGHRVLHIDLYRLSDAADLAPLGLRDEFVPGSLLLIEWPERAAQFLPTPDLNITLTMARVGRTARLEPGGAMGVVWLQAALRQFYPELNRV